MLAQARCDSSPDGELPRARRNGDHHQGCCRPPKLGKVASSACSKGQAKVSHGKCRRNSRRVQKRGARLCRHPLPWTGRAGCLVSPSDNKSRCAGHLCAAQVPHCQQVDHSAHAPRHRHQKKHEDRSHPRAAASHLLLPRAACAGRRRGVRVKSQITGTSNARPPNHQASSNVKSIYIAHINH